MASNYDDYPTWEIENQKVKEADESRVELNTRCSIHVNQAHYNGSPHFSSISIERIRTSIGGLRKRFSNLSGEELATFDEIVLEDIKRNVAVVDAYYKYLLNPRDNSTTFGKGFITAMFGNASFKYFSKTAIEPSNYPHKDIDRESELFHLMMKRRVDSEMIFTAQEGTFVNLKNDFFKKLNANKDFVDEFYKSVGIQDEDYALLPAPLGWEFSFWDDNLGFVAIDPESVICYVPKRKKTPTFFDAAIKPLAVHERAHGLHTKFSKKMPSGFQGSDETFFNPVHGPDSEGIALSAEIPSIDYLKRNRVKYHLSDEDIERVVLSRKCYIPKKLFQIAYSLINAEEWEATIKAKMPESLRQMINVRKMLAQRSGIKRIRKDHFMFDDEALENLIPRMVYPVGEKRTQSLVLKMQEQGHNYEVILPALFHGYWSSTEAKERFIFECYLPEIEG